MSQYSIDPLDGIEQRPLEVQVAVLCAELRNQRNMLSSVRSELGAVKKALYTVALTVTGSAVIFAITTFALIGGHHP